MVTWPGKGRGVRAQRPAGRIAIAGIHAVERGPQPLEVRGIARMDDIEIERRHRRAAEYGRHSADHDQFDIVPGEDLKRVFEPLAHLSRRNSLTLSTKPWRTWSRSAGARLSIQRISESSSSGPSG